MAYERYAPYKPGQMAAFKLSRSKIDLFMQCPRCFWLDTRLKIKRPSGPPFQINKAIDELFKKEFDSYRVKKQPHPLMTDNQIQAVPMQHENLDMWRHNFTGVQTLHESTNLHIFGAIDDIWVDESGLVYVVDYKATSKPGEITLDAEWQNMYKRQMEIYQWLLRRNGLDVSDTGYFVYTNGRLDLDGFNDRLEFRTKIISYTGTDKWVEPTIIDMKKCMDNETMPAVGRQVMDTSKPCEYCTYARERTELTLKDLQKRKK